MDNEALDKAVILEKHAGAIRQLVDAGYDLDLVVDAVVAGDLSKLKATPAAAD